VDIKLLHHLIVSIEIVLLTVRFSRRRASSPPQNHRLCFRTRSRRDSNVRCQNVTLGLVIAAGAASLAVCPPGCATAIYCTMSMSYCFSRRQWISSHDAISLCPTRLLLLAVSYLRAQRCRGIAACASAPVVTISPASDTRVLEFVTAARFLSGRMPF